MFERLNIQSHKGVYSVCFNSHLCENLDQLIADGVHFLVDANIAHFYADRMQKVLDHPNTQVINATEENKSIEKIIPVLNKLVENSVRRNHTLIAIGGGIIQDITCFIASTLLRGMKWKFVPTTLLAQADSCIGSKSCINLGKAKNILGTFNPPAEIIVCVNFLDTLHDAEICSGIGEMLKVHAIDSAASFDQLARDYNLLKTDRGVLLKYVRRALNIKQRYIEIDEFDRGVRNIFNYGHSFGHAIEAATDFKVPHGIAVTMGMDMANRIAVMRDLLPEHHYRRMHPVLHENYRPYANSLIPLPIMISALMKDKKNTSDKLVLIFPVGDMATIERVEVTPDDAFRDQCQRFLEEMKA